MLVRRSVGLAQSTYGRTSRRHRSCFRLRKRTRRTKLFHLRLQGCQSAIEPRLDRRQGCFGYRGNLFQRKLFVKTKNQNFSVRWLQLEQNLAYFSAIFAGLELLKRRGRRYRDFKRAFILSPLAHLIETCHGALSRKVDHQIACNSKEPRVESCLAVVLRS